MITESWMTFSWLIIHNKEELKRTHDIIKVSLKALQDKRISKVEKVLQGVNNRRKQLYH